MSKIIYTTGYFCNDKTENNNHEWRIKNFLELAQTGIDLYVYTNIIHIFANINLPTNVKLFNYKLPPVDHQKKLPNIRNETKDTAFYLTLINEKLNLVKRTTDIFKKTKSDTNGAYTKYFFAWIDFSIRYVFVQLPKTLDFLQFLTTAITPAASNTLIIAGCWDATYTSVFLQEHKQLMDNNGVNNADNVCWRFCGGFFVGDAQSISNWKELADEKKDLFFKEKYTWEVNYWTWLEQLNDYRFKPIWYYADHNDKIILNFPTGYYYYIPCWEKKTKISLKTTNIHNTSFPSSCCFFIENNTPMLNIRYVNYYIMFDGRYLFPNGGSYIQSKNVCYQLTKCGDFYELECDAGAVLETEPKFLSGLEDLRVAPPQCFGTVIDDNRGVFFRANYNVENKLISNVLFLESKDGGWEKNWIPFPPNQNEQFIYKWRENFFEVVSFQEDGSIKEVKKYTHNIHLLGKARGSSLFCQWKEPDTFIGVVHFSEDNNIPPLRFYYHILVVLTGEYQIKYCSAPFIFFDTRGIEFCIGYHYGGGGGDAAGDKHPVGTENKHHFWVSENDRDPHYFCAADDAFF